MKKVMSVLAVAMPIYRPFEPVKPEITNAGVECTWKAMQASKTIPHNPEQETKR